MEFVQCFFFVIKANDGFPVHIGISETNYSLKIIQMLPWVCVRSPSSANLIPQPWHPLFAPNFKLLTCASTLLAAHQNNSGTEVFGHIESVKIRVILNPNDYMLTDIFRFCFLHLRYNIQIPRNWSVNFLNYDQREPAVSYRWTSWIWEITGWSSRLQETHGLF